MLLLIIPITIITLIYRYDIVRIVFMRGTFQESDVQRVGNLIMVYAIGFVPSVISNIYMHVHYAEGQTTITMKYSLISIGANIITSILLSRLIGLLGIAIGTVISIVISVVLYSRSVRKCISEYRGFLSLKKILKLASATAVCVIITFTLHTNIYNPLVSFVLGSCLGMGTFFIVLFIEKEESVKEIVELVMKRMRR